MKLFSPNAETRVREYPIPPAGYGTADGAIELAERARAGRAPAGRDAQVAKVPVAAPVEAPVISGARSDGEVVAYKSTDNVAVNNSR